MAQQLNFNEYKSYFSDPKFWGKVRSVARKAGAKAIYVALVLYYTLSATTTSIKDKSIIYGALGYFILPVDLIPDAIPMVGFSDDLAALVAAFWAVHKNITPEVIDQARTKLAQWFPDIRDEDIDIDEQ